MQGAKTCFYLARCGTAEAGALIQTGFVADSRFVSTFTAWLGTSFPVYNPSYFLHTHDWSNLFARSGLDTVRVNKEFIDGCRRHHVSRMPLWGLVPCAQDGHRLAGVSAGGVPQMRTIL